MAWALALSDPATDFGPFLLAVGLAGGAWLVLTQQADRGALSNHQVRILVVLALVLRGYALIQAPAFSHDLDRYVYEGRLAWWGGLGLPFQFPPAEAPSHGVPPDLLDAGWARINHPEISTIYPPFAQLVFVLAGALGAALGHTGLILKGLLVGAELGAWALLARVRPAWALGFGLAPIGILETAREGHADVLSGLGLALMVVGFLRARPSQGYLGLALAGLAKLNGLWILPAALRSSRRGLAPLLLLGLLALPALLAGPSAFTGLGAYASRWRAGDAVFSLVVGLAEQLLGGDWRQIGAFTLTRHALARGLTFAGLLLAMGLVLRRPAPPTAIPGRAGLLLLLLLLLAPTFHPWYALWLLPIAIGVPEFLGRKAVLWAILSAPLLHAAAHLEAVTGTWDDPLWARLLVHGPAWLLLIRDLVRAARFGYPPPGEGEERCRSTQDSSSA